MPHSIKKLIDSYSATEGGTSAGATVPPTAEEPPVVAESTAVEEPPPPADDIGLVPGGTKSAQAAERSVHLSTWYPAIGIAALYFFLLQSYDPKWAHPRKPHVGRLGFRGDFSVCEGHGDCAFITDCPREGMFELSYVEENLFCYEEEYTGVPEALVGICWSVKYDPWCPSAGLFALAFNGTGIAFKSDDFGFRANASEFAGQCRNGRLQRPCSTRLNSTAATAQS